MGPWAGYLTSLSFSFLAFKMRRIKIGWLGLGKVHETLGMVPGTITPSQSYSLSITDEQCGYTSPSYRKQNALNTHMGMWKKLGWGREA